MQQGDFSEHVLKNWIGYTLFSIDAWQNFDEEAYVDIVNRSDDQQILIYANTSLQLAPFGVRSVVWRMTSEQGASVMPDDLFDFC